MPSDDASMRRRRASLAEVNAEPGPPVLHWAVVILNALMRPFVRPQWRATEKLPRVGGIVVAVNHISNADPLAVGQFLAYSGRWPRFLAKASLFRVPVVGWLLRATGQLPVERHTRAAGTALTAAVAAVKEGQAVIVYPEGTITSDPDLWPMKGKTGVARIAFAAGCPVIPVGQWGAQEIMYGKRLHFPHLLPPKKLYVLVGDPVPLSDLQTEPVTAVTLNAATERVLDAITALVAELRREQPPTVRFDPRSVLDAGSNGSTGGAAPA
jgi:1-acyl-sn-glycerol-3-phosphate acyltransferase